jgi:DNA-binding NtrC family response regulator
MERLVQYAWPGNVRELGNVIERAVVLGRPPRITREDLPPRVAAAPTPERAAAQSYPEAVNAFRRELITAALARAAAIERRPRRRWACTVRISCGC